MGYSYDRSRVLTAGRNGRLLLDGHNSGPDSSGTLTFNQQVTIAPQFKAHHLDEAIKRTGEGGLDRILKAVARQVPGLQVKIIDSFAGQSTNLGLEVGAKATWKGDADKLLAALQGFEDSFGYTLTNWL